MINRLCVIQRDYLDLFNFLFIMWVVQVIFSYEGLLPLLTFGKKRKRLSPQVVRGFVLLGKKLKRRPWWRVDPRTTCPRTLPLTTLSLTSVSLTSLITDYDFTPFLSYNWHASVTPFLSPLTFHICLLVRGFCPLLTFQINKIKVIIVHGTNK